MKRALILGMLLLLLIACQQEAKETPTQQTTDAPKTETETSTPAPETAKETATADAAQKSPDTQMVKTPPPLPKPLPSERTQTQPESTVVVAPSKIEASPQLRDLLKRADEKVQSMQYLYGGSDTANLFLDTYLVKGDKMKIKKYEENYYVRENYFDTVYVNLNVGCCEKLSRCKSHNVDNSNKKFDVDVKSLSIPKTPYQWVKEIQGGQVIGPQTFNERSVTFMKYTNADGNEVDMWIDDTYGLPHKIVVKDKDGNELEKHQFNDLTFNTLKDAEFDAPCD